MQLQSDSQNLDYAQRLLLQTEMTDKSSDMRTFRLKILSLQEGLGEHMNAFEESEPLETWSDSSSEPDLNQLPPSLEPSATASKSPSASEKVLSTQEHILQNHREAQESISDDLLVMAQALRENQTKFGQSILRDNDLIEKTGEALHINASKMRATGSRLGEYSRKSSSMCWLSVGAVLVAFVSFFIMIGIIRVT